LPTFAHAHGAVTALANAPRLQRETAAALAAFRPDVAIETMAHVWSPLLEGVLRRSGVRRTVIVHDAHPHPGDPAAIVTRWLRASALRADKVVTLSRFVAAEIGARATPLWHADMPLGPAAPMPAALRLRVLCFGRLHAYKGLDLLVEGAELARAEGARFDIEVRGEGRIAPLRVRLDALGADVDARWQSDAELAAALARCHVVAATYREASQSGVIAAANAAQRPSLATPVGALPEQVRSDATGLVAARTDARSVADCLVRLAAERDLVMRLASTLAAEAPARAMPAFARALLDVAAR